MMTPGKVLEGEAEEEGLTVKEVRGIISKMKKEVRGPAYSRRLKAANKYQILREQFNAVQRGCRAVKDLDDVYSMMKTPDRERRYGGIDVNRGEVQAAQRGQLISTLNRTGIPVTQTVLTYADQYSGTFNELIDNLEKIVDEIIRNMIYVPGGDPDRILAQRLDAKLLAML
jgi:hypothetical protein